MLVLKINAYQSGAIPAPLLWSWLALRQNVFVIEQDCLYQDIDEIDDRSIHYLMHDNQQVLAGCRMFEQSGYWQLGRMVVAPSARKQKLGFELLKQVVKQYQTLEIRLHAQSHLTGFYETAGFQTTGEPFDEDGISHVLMIRTPTPKANQ